MVKYNPVNNTNIEKCVIKELEEIKDETFRSGFIQACISLGYKIPLIKEAYKRLIMGFYLPTKKEEQEEEPEPKQKSSSSVNKKANNAFKEIAKLYYQVIGQPNGLTSQWIESILAEYGLNGLKMQCWNLKGKTNGVRNMLKVS